LNWLLARDLDSELHLQVTLRLAKVYAAQTEYDQALQLLDVDAGVYAPAYQELIGDIYKSQGELEQALQAYQQAQQLAEQAEKPLANGVLALKIDNLSNQLAIASQGS
jgi:predicted negative regulator of RcsB-dependent stress response